MTRTDLPGNGHQSVSELAAITHVLIAASDDLDAIHTRETALFDQAYRLGYGAGYAHGLVQGDRQAADRWVGFGKLGQSLTHAELEARRTHSDDRACPEACGRCSACLRAAHLTRIRARRC